MEINFKKIKFFVEGIADTIFLRDLLKLLYKSEFEKKQLQELIVECGGFDGISRQVNEFKEINPANKRENGRNILFFDADYSGREINHGFVNKCKYLETKKDELEIDFDYYLFPDNENDGTIETLLESCVNEQHKSILLCWNSYEGCIKSISGKKLYNSCK